MFIFYTKHLGKAENRAQSLTLNNFKVKQVYLYSTYKAHIKESALKRQKSFKAE